MDVGSGRENTTAAIYVPPYMRNRRDSMNMGKTEPRADIAALASRNEVYHILSSVRRQCNKMKGYADTRQQLERVFEMFRRSPASSGRVMLGGMPEGDAGVPMPVRSEAKVIIDVVAVCKFAVSMAGQVLEMYSLSPHDRVIVTIPTPVLSGRADHTSCGTMEFDFKVKNRLPLEGALYERIKAIAEEMALGRKGVGTGVTLEAYAMELGRRLSASVELYDKKVKVIVRVSRRRFNMEERHNTVCLCKPYGGGLALAAHTKAFVHMHMGLTLQQNLEFLHIERHPFEPFARGNEK